MIVAISAWRVRRYPENAEYIQAWDDDSWRLLELFDRIGADTVACELGAPRPPVATDELAQRRTKALGAVLTPLTYCGAGARESAAKGCGSTTPTATGCSTRTTTCPSSATAIRA